MHMTEIQDWQFGQLQLDEDWGWCAEEFEWTPGSMIGLCIKAELTKDNRLPEHVRTMFNTLRDRENDYLILALQKNMLDAYHEAMSDDDSSVGESSFDAHTFINLIELNVVVIDTNEQSELQYYTGGGPLLRLFISPDLSFKEVFFD